MAEDDALSAAIATYLGYRVSATPGSSWPEPDAFTPATRQQAESIVFELSSYVPNWSKYPVDQNLNLAADDVAHLFAGRYPSLSTSALDALRWSFTWQWR